jgi:thiol:disulfide interchange protein DsbD
LAWSLKQPAAVGASAIIVVGCGMASPYLILSAFPQIARRFPKTGRVGEIIKQTLAFFVLATAVYFARPLVGAWVNPTVFWWGLFAIIAVGCVFMVGRMIKSVGTPRAIGISAVIAVLAIAGSAYATSLFARNPHDWQPYSDQALADAIKAGRPVLIDFTADWCLNCHTLEALTLNNGDVVTTVLAEKVLMLKADVTHGTEAAVPLKNKLLPAGEIPLTAVYVPGRNEPTLLKGIYSVGEWLKVLPRAGRSAS